MSTIDPTSQAQLDTILKRLGVNGEEDNKPKHKDTLGQSDFLKLMTTQLQNQDPFAPMENAEFIAQMAQFSTGGVFNGVRHHDHCRSSRSR